MGKKSKNQKPVATKKDFCLDKPSEVSEEEFSELITQVAELSEEEAQEEWLACARYGEVDGVRALLGRFPSLVEFSESISGNSALHMAAANGHVSVAKLLIAHYHPFRKNLSGNSPLHWAASNGHSEMVQFFTTVKDFEVDVLEKNSFGRSALTEGFTSQKEEVVKSLLEHDSAAEEKLLATDDQSKTKVVHKLFSAESPILVRELAMTNADNPFADSERPDQDTTGLSIWSASLVMARWMMTKDWTDKSVVELGSGCGVPGICIAASNPAPEKVFLTDLNPATVENLLYNVSLNDLRNAEALCMDWDNKISWPSNQVEYVVGSDLIYQKSLVPLLVGVVFGLLKPGGYFYYVAPDTGRDGLDEFIREMKEKFTLLKQEESPNEFHTNPLANQDDDECFLHFHELSSTKYILYEFQKDP